MVQKINEQDTAFVTAKTPLHGQPVASLFFTHGVLAGKEIPLTRDTFFIGRSKNNHLVLPETSVSRKHAVLNYMDNNYVLSDLNSMKGTYVNGSKIEEQILQPGDVINIGENRMQFRMLTPSGNWVAPQKKSRIWGFLLLIILGIGAAVGTWFFAQYYFSKSSISDAALAKIEVHYERGVEYFNRDRDVQRAREEWERILRLDPEMKTDYAIKASILLKNTEQKEEGK